MLETVQDEISLQRERYKTFYDRMLSNFICDHYEIVHYVRSRDGERAREAMMGHISSVWAIMFDVPLDIREPGPKRGYKYPD
jgi:DNA-binding GntR family transcriptional regulator